MKDFSHPNILGLTGVCFDTPDGVPYIILPFMANGSLKDFLKKKRTHVTNVDILSEVKGLNRQLERTVARALYDFVVVCKLIL